MCVLSRACTDLVTTHPLLSVWNRVLTGMHPNSVTVAMYFATKTEVDHKLKQRNQTNGFVRIKHTKAGDYEEESQKVMCYIPPHDLANFSVQFLLSSLLSSHGTWSLFHPQLSCPGVDQETLSWTRGASQHNLPQQRGIPWDLQRVEMCTQSLLAARAVPVVDLIHDTLEDRVVLDSHLCLHHVS